MLRVASVYNEPQQRISWSSAFSLHSLTAALLVHHCWVNNVLNDHLLGICLYFQTVLRQCLQIWSNYSSAWSCRHLKRAHNNQAWMNFICKLVKLLSASKTCISKNATILLLLVKRCRRCKDDLIMMMKRRRWSLATGGSAGSLLTPTQTIQSYHLQYLQHNLWPPVKICSNCQKSCLNEIFAVQF